MPASIISENSRGRLQGSKNVLQDRGLATSLFPDLLQARSPCGFDAIFHEKGFALIAGIDEVGRGPLAGPVVAAAVVLPAGEKIEGMADSKKITPRRREELHGRILSRAIAVGLGVVGPEEIDRLNILEATLKAMELALRDLDVVPDLVLVDGNQPISSSIPQVTVRKGDTKSQSIAAASIVAKVKRDKLMVDYHELYPCYAFNRHKGYGTRDHLRALRRYGCCPIHRKSFKGVRELLEGDRPQGLFRFS